MSNAAGVALTTGLAVAVLVGGCASPPPDPPVERVRPTVPDRPTDQPTVRPTEPSFVPAPPSPGANPPSQVDPAAAPVPDGPCQPGQLDISTSAVDAALGYRQMRIRVNNHSSVPCVLAGYAALSARGASGTVFTNPQGRMHDSETAPARTVPLRPGAVAHVDVGWRGDLAAAGVEQTASMTVVVSSGSSPATVPLDPSSAVDVVDGTEIRVGGWRRGAD